MNRQASASPPDYQALQQAADWYAQLLEADHDSELHARWLQWLSASDAHRQAWQYVETISQRFQPLRGDVTPLASQTLLQPSTPLTRRYTLRLGALLATGSLLSWLTWRHTPVRESLLALAADYRTGTGEIRHVSLSDGTQLWLDTASALDVRYTDVRRQLHLIAGEILLDTAPDTLRPLFVASREGDMQALGSRFSLRQLADSTQLTVYTGSVAVTPRQAGPLRQIDAGRQWRFDANGAGFETPMGAQDADWRQGMLHASDTPLGDVVARLARYRHGYLACAPNVAALRVVGTFPLMDTDRALAMLSRALPVRIHRRFDWWITVEPV
ncbi:anti-FecI sigma factor, FecR [Musicola paradisiaca Ech703]|uniref:Anti-FecI sigma factor, FecR n=1 Tax=Musicola paradisiaca (strain Ech703) TaxID=579405 RepID=C6CDZ5_MUSP7|nr:FecR domain-containing protein [Musicola paradisiaca]ACS87089.1 anti-FecI sigma factor, FecR [Musicola paradisiaca Ech703]